VNAEWENPRNNILARICLPEIIALYLGSLHSYISDSKWYTLPLAFFSFVNAKQANQRNFILARICLVEIIGLYLGSFLNSYISDSKWYTILFSSSVNAK